MMVAKDNPIEDLEQTNAELFPDKRVVSALYTHPNIRIELPPANAYIAECAQKLHYPALYVAHPSQSAEDVERDVLANPVFKGLKVYLEYAPSYIPNSEIRIYDFLTPEHLALADRYGWVVQLLIAHLGRAYADEDVGNGLEYLKDTRKMIWDFTANTNENVMRQVLERFGPERLIYGSDFPVFRMKARRVAENGFYINEVPKGSLGDVSDDPHMREIDYPEAEKITFFIYEEMDACRRACEKLGLTKEDVRKIFWENSARVFGYTENF